MKENRDEYIEFLHGAYQRGLDNNNVEYIKGYGKIVDKNTVDVDGTEYTADHILIATGGRPKRLDIPGAEYGIDSDGFFDLEELPESIAIIGGGYIGVEISGLLRSFCVEFYVFVCFTSVFVSCGLW